MITNPLNSLRNILELIEKNIKILPAVGGAVEDLVHPDQDEIEDKIINKEDEIINSFAEIPEPNPKNIYFETLPLFRKEKHLFKYFIDGSLRTYFLGTGIEGSRTFPIELAQIGAALVSRDNDGHLKALKVKRKIVLLIPKYQSGISDTLWLEINKIKLPDEIKIEDYTIPDKLSDMKSDLRDKAGAKARSLMHKLEGELIKETDNLRNDDNWLIIDGSVKFVEEDIWNSLMNKPYVIGVAKSFRKDPMFELGLKKIERKDLTNILSDLPHNYRTAAFKAFDGKIAFWYVRMREQKEVDYPLMGVVKVEIPCPNKRLVNSELINLISSALVAERNVTPYGLDRRWHCSIYPIYIAEQIIKNNFYSELVLKGYIKW